MRKENNKSIVDSASQLQKNLDGTLVKSAGEYKGTGQQLDKMQDKSDQTKSTKPKAKLGRQYKVPKYATWKNPLSLLTISWFWPVVREGFKRPLQFEDVPYILDDMHTQNSFPKFWTAYENSTKYYNNKDQKKSKKVKKPLGQRAIVRSLLRLHGARLAAGTLCQLVYTGLQFVAPILLRLLTQFIIKSKADENVPVSRGYIIACFMLLTPIVASVFFVQSNRIAIGTQVLIRGELMSAIYRKALYLSNTSRQSIEQGRIVNLMSADMNNVVNMFYPFLNTMLTAPITLIVSLVLLGQTVGVFVLIGLALLLTTTPLSGFMMKRLMGLRMRMLKSTDVRVKYFGQLLSGIRVVKMYGWGDNQVKRVEDARQAEIKCLKSQVYIRVIFQTMLFSIPMIASALTLASYGLVHPEKFTVDRVFSAIVYFNIMRFPLIFLPFALIQVGNGYVSLGRLGQYFTLDELDTYVEQLDTPAIRITGGTFKWAAPDKELASRLDVGGKKGGNNKKAGKPGGKKGPGGPPPAAQGGPPGQPTKPDDSATAEVDYSFFLRDVDINIEAGELVMVVGRVGAGKTSLVLSLLGEMEKVEGRVQRGGNVAYVSQSAWIVNDTLRGNVELGTTDRSQGQFDDVVYACSLTDDLAMLPAGEETEIGENGINLSGGQKQRVSLARAVLSDADIYIMDDPLSAVDVHVGKHIFNECIQGKLKSKTRVLVTNQLQYLSKADKVIFVESGKISSAGTLDDACQHQTFMNMLEDFTNTMAQAQEASAPTRSSNTFDRVAEPPLVQQSSSMQNLLAIVKKGSAEVEQPASKDTARQSIESENASSSTCETTTTEPTSITEVDIKENSPSQAVSDAQKKAIVPMDKTAQLVQAEDRETGDVKAKVYSGYIGAYGIPNAIAVVLFWCLEQSNRILTMWWLSQWSGARTVEISLDDKAPDGDSGKIITTPTENPSKTSEYYVTIYGVLLATNIILIFCRACTNLLSALRASKKVHSRSIHGLIRSPMSFFDTTPIGRILNRFSKDMDDMDYQLPQSLTEYGTCLMTLASSLVFISIIQRWLLIAVVPLCVIYYFINVYFRKSFIELQRLDAVTRSPIYQQFTETITGVQSIRSFGLIDQFSNRFRNCVNDNHTAYFGMKVSDEWLTLRLDMIGSTISFGTAILSVIQRNTLSFGLIAVSLSESIDVTIFLKQAVKSAANMEARFNSVERLLAYKDLPPEKPDSIPSKKPDDKWPQYGHLTYEDIHMRYRSELSPVLKGVSLDVPAGCKVGIVGRTGSGKSSLIVTLFRLVEPFQGKITLDGVNLLEIGLNDVRQRIAAIPQDPVVFSGPVRASIDPYDQHTDAELWDALEMVAMKDVVSAMDGKLEAQVSEKGENFSLGQRQLICVARALLRKPRVLVMDEATASLDSETDSLIQKTIRSAFADCTILVIAHRLSTVLDLDRVLVMQDGLAAEYDTVDNLLAKKDGIFKQMVEAVDQEGHEP